MAKRRRRKNSLGGYFRQVFEENPSWLDIKSNDLIQERYEADHPGKQMTTKIRANMANIKSLLRKQMRENGHEGGRRKAKVAAVTLINLGVQSLEGLELAIDDCLSAARQLDPTGLDPVIQSLRRARYQLVLQMGEP